MHLTFDDGWVGWRGGGVGEGGGLHLSTLYPSTQELQVWLIKAAGNISNANMALIDLRTSTQISQIRYQ